MMFNLPPLDRPGRPNRFTSAAMLVIAAAIGVPAFGQYTPSPFLTPLPPASMRQPQTSPQARAQAGAGNAGTADSSDVAAQLPDRAARYAMLQEQADHADDLVQDAKQNLDASRKQVARQQQHDPAYVKARQAVAKASHDTAQVRQAMLVSLQKDPLYAQTLQKISDVDGHIDRLWTQKPVPQSKIQVLAKKKLRLLEQAQSAIAKVAAKNTKLQRLEAELAAARKNLTQLQARQAQAINQDPGVVQAQRNLDQAQANRQWIQEALAGAKAGYQVAMALQTQQQEQQQYPYYYYYPGYSPYGYPYWPGYRNFPFISYRITYHRGKDHGNRGNHGGHHGDHGGDHGDQTPSQPSRPGRSHTPIVPFSQARPTGSQTPSANRGISAAPRQSSPPPAAQPSPKPSRSTAAVVPQ